MYSTPGAGGFTVIVARCQDVPDQATGVTKKQYPLRGDARSQGLDLHENASHVGQAILADFALERDLPGCRLLSGLSATLRELNRPRIAAAKQSPETNRHPPPCIGNQAFH